MTLKGDQGLAERPQSLHCMLKALACGELAAVLTASPLLDAIRVISTAPGIIRNLGFRGCAHHPAADRRLGIQKA